MLHTYMYIFFLPAILTDGGGILEKETHSTWRIPWTVSPEGVTKSRTQQSKHTPLLPLPQGVIFNPSDQEWLLLSSTDLWWGKTFFPDHPLSHLLKRQTKEQKEQMRIFALLSLQLRVVKKMSPGTQQDIKKEILGLHLWERRKDVGMNSLQNSKYKYPPLAKR